MALHCVCVDSGGDDIRIGMLMVWPVGLASASLLLRRRAGGAGSGSDCRCRAPTMIAVLFQPETA